jgi:hypothetical protein
LIYARRTGISVAVEKSLLFIRRIEYVRCEVIWIKGIISVALIYLLADVLFVGC